jgi:hypothetical protein
MNSMCRKHIQKAIDTMDLENVTNNSGVLAKVALFKNVEHCCGAGAACFFPPELEMQDNDMGKLFQGFVK